MRPPRRRAAERRRTCAQTGGQVAGATRSFGINALTASCGRRHDLVDLLELAPASAPSCPAAALALTCSGDVAPAMTDAQPGCAARPPMAISRMDASCSRAPGDERLHLVELRVGDVARAGWPAGCRAGCPGRAATLPVSRPFASGKYGSTPSPKWSAAGTTSASASRSSSDQWFCAEMNGVRPDARRGVRGVRDLPAGQVGVPDVADLARGDQLIERGDGLLDRRQRVRRVQLVQVDVVGAQAPEGFLHGEPDVAPAALGAGRGAIPHVHPLVAELRREHHLVPAALENLAKSEFRAAVLAVHLGGVEERDAGVDGRVDHGARARSTSRRPPKLLQPRPTTETSRPESPTVR